MRRKRETGNRSPAFAPICDVFLVLPAVRMRLRKTVALFDAVAPLGVFELEAFGLILQQVNLFEQLRAYGGGLLAAGGIGLDHHRDLPDALGHLGNGGRLGDIPHGAVKECHNLPAGAGAVGGELPVACAAGDLILHCPGYRLRMSVMGGNVGKLCRYWCHL